MATSHDLMRKAMAEHGITADELIDHIHHSIGGDRARIVEVVERFVEGGPGVVAVHMAVIAKVVERNLATTH